MQEELENLLDSVVILINPNEQNNKHINFYLTQNRISHRVKALPVGDYSVMLPQNMGLGIEKDMFFQIVVKRFSTVKEVEDSINNGLLKDELMRAQNIDVIVLIEEVQDQQNQVKTFEQLKQLNKHNLLVNFSENKSSGSFIVKHLKYYVKRTLQKEIN